jgi:hypothetical protein
VAASVTNIFDSTALPLLLALEARGIHVELTADGRLIVEPASRLRPTTRRRCDREVQERREAFAAQLAHTPPPGVPAFLFCPDVPYVKGTCFSCGVVLRSLVFARCWRCSLAYRLACGLSIPADLIVAMDAARVVA